MLARAEKSRLALQVRRMCAMEMTPEFRLFTLALRRPQQDEDRASLQAAIAARPRWDAVLDGARRHRVPSHLFEGLRGFGASIPEPVFVELSRAAHVAARRGLAQTAEVARVARLLAAAGIEALALKGVALSQQLYGDAALRSPTAAGSKNMS